MERQILCLWLLVTAGVAGLLAFLVVWIIYGTHDPKKIILVTYREISGLLQEKQKESNSYQRMERWLRKNGAAYHFGKKITPMKFLISRILLAMCGVCVFIQISTEVAFVAGIGLYFLPCLLLQYLNKRDNERLLPELKLVYHALEVQIRAGVYVTDALVECYGSVREPRLRNALLDLAGDIVMRADIYRAFDKFQAAFENRYVDSLCITMLQALESGQAVELLSDIGEQIRDMEQRLLERKKAALDRSITFYQLGILIVVLGIALYACMADMLGAAIVF